MNPIIERTELQALLASARPPLLVEALPASHYEQAHLPGAIHLPHDEVARLAADRLPDLDRPVVVYCVNRQCRNSVIAAQELRRLGYRHVREYSAGKQDWIDAGMPVEASTAAAA